MRGILREPLAHFLAIGALMFAVNAEVADGNRDPGVIVVGQGQIDTMTTVFERTWRRTPTPEDMQALIDGYVREEVLYREGIAMGLDQDDALIRRRVRQKVEFLAESMHGIPEPTDAALQVYLDGHREQFADPVRVSFRQVYLGTAADADTTRLLAQLNELGDSDAAADMGSPTQLDARMELAPTADVERVFGRPFAQAIAVTPPGVWRGPIASEYGVHLVRVNERVDARTPALGEVRERVKRDWLRDELAKAQEQYYKELRAGYTVRVESPSLARAQ